MKKIMLFFFSILALNISSCQQNKQEDIESLLETIAKDPVYIDYERVVYERIAFITQNTWNVNEVMDLYLRLEAKYGSDMDFCAIPASEFEGVRGGKIWQEADCKYDKAAEALKRKYNYFKMPDEQTDRIFEIFLDNGGRKLREEVRQQAFEYLMNNPPKK